MTINCLKYQPFHRSITMSQGIEASYQKKFQLMQKRLYRNSKELIDPFICSLAPQRKNDRLIQTE